MPPSPSSPASQSPYQHLEDITLQAITAQILHYLDASELVPITLLNTAVGLLRAGKIPQSSTEELRGGKAVEGEAWLQNLPESVQKKLGSA